MTELKTLKDFDESKDYDEGSWDSIFGDLKQEAIKWLKEFEKAEEDCKDALSSDGTEPLKADPVAYYDKMDWIKYFFNIIKGDLK